MSYLSNIPRVLVKVSIFIAFSSTRILFLNFENKKATINTFGNYCNKYCLIVTLH